MLSLLPTRVLWASPPFFPSLPPHLCRRAPDVGRGRKNRSEVASGGGPPKLCLSPRLVCIFREKRQGKAKVSLSLIYSPRSVFEISCQKWKDISFDKYVQNGSTGYSKNGRQGKGYFPSKVYAYVLQQT